MTNLRRIAVVSALVFLYSIFTASGAAADLRCSNIINPDGNRGSAGCIREEHTHEVGDPNAGGGGPRTAPNHQALWNRFCRDGIASLGSWRSGYTVDISRQGQVPPGDYDHLNAENNPRLPYFEEGVVYYNVQITCNNGAAVPVSYITVAAEGDLGVPLVDLIALRDEALAQIEVPDPVAELNPPADAGEFGIVHVPTWFWIDEADWQPLTGSASEGGFTVTVTATPIEAAWTPGDGKPAVVCLTAGTPWSPGMPEDGTDCSHTYISSSADQPAATYTVNLAVTWEFTWTINGAEQGPFGEVEPDVDLDYQVGEIQALET